MTNKPMQFKKCTQFIFSLFLSLSIPILLLCMVVFAVEIDQPILNWQPAIQPDYENHIIWGKEKDGLKAGVLIDYGVGSNQFFVGFFPVLYYHPLSSNLPENLKYPWLWLPPFDSRYQLNLTDANGISMGKTKMGKQLGQPIVDPLRLTIGINFKAGYRSRILNPDYPEIISTDPIVLQNYFKITNAGKYNLKFEMNVIWPKETNGTNLVHLPPVNIEVEIKKP